MLIILNRFSLKFLLLIPGLCLTMTSFSFMPDSLHFTDIRIAEDRNLILSLDYGSDKIFHGRTSSIREPYIAPSLYYEAPSGFFTSISGDHLLSPYNSWDELDLNIGWSFSLSKKMELSVSYTHLKFGNQSNLLRSSLNNDLELLLQKNSEIVTSKLYFNYDFGNGKTPNDYSFTFDNSHDFIFENLLTENNDVLKIKPALSIIAGTLNFYKLHLKKQKDKPALQNQALDVNTKSV